jgi:hypothetical protein
MKVGESGGSLTLSIRDIRGTLPGLSGDLGLDLGGVLDASTLDELGETLDEVGGGDAGGTGPEGHDDCWDDGEGRQVENPNRLANELLTCDHEHMMSKLGLHQRDVKTVAIHRKDVRGLQPLTGGQGLNVGATIVALRGINQPAAGHREVV